MTEATRLTWADVRARRLERHALLERAPRGRLVDVVRDVCGIHAQVMSAAEVSIGTRVWVKREDVAAALWTERTLVKAYGVRGTVHLLSSDELPLWVASHKASGRRGNEEDRLAALGLDQRKVDMVVDAIAQALDGRRLTLRALEDEVVRRAGSWGRERRVSAFGGAWPVWRVGLGYAARAGLLCFGPNEGTQVTYALPHQWLRGWREIDTPVALAEVFRRFVRTYGPATYRDFAQWFAINPGIARDVANALGGELVTVDVEGYRCLALAADVSEGAPALNGSVRLLPHFDCYLRGFHPRSALVGEFAARSAGGTGQAPVVLVDGTVAGVWERHAAAGKRLEVRVDPFVPLRPDQRRELEAEAARLGEFLGLEPTLAIGAVTVRAHL
ncbi:MAG: winged helix DNA-binding domain-containing protein [Candidatus Limnocylindria bacterium]